jgi:hypothetical protein
MSSHPRAVLLFSSFSLGRARVDLQSVLGLISNLYLYLLAYSCRKKIALLSKHCSLVPVVLVVWLALTCRASRTSTIFQKIERPG